MAAGSSGIESTYAAEQSRASEQTGGPQQSSAPSTVEKQAKQVLDTSYANNSDSPSTAHSDAIKKLEFLLEISPSQSEKDTLAKLLDSLQKTDPQHLLTPDQRQVWMSAQHNPTPQGFITQANHMAEAAATPFKPQNLFGPKPISEMNSMEMNLNQDPDGQQNREAYKGFIEKIKGFFKK